MINLFISDLHLEENRPDITHIFLKFMSEEAIHAQALYILGDFFEAWIGDDDLSPFHLSIIKALRTASDKGLAIYFMHGNRDFLIGKKFLRASGCKLLPDEFIVNLGGIPTLLMHGDTLCTEDKAYLKFRKKSRNWFFQKLFLWKSLAARRKIAENMRVKSKAYTSTAPEYLMDVSQSEVERVMLKHSVKFLIHGHTHRPAVHHFQLSDGTQMTRTVLGPWHEFGNVLVCTENAAPVMKILTSGN